MAARRELIIEAALEVIAEGGLGSFTQPRVSKRAGLRQSHLTYYFPTRDELLFAVAEEAVRRRLAALSAITTADAAQDKLTALADVLASPTQTRVLIALTQSADQYEAVRVSFESLARGLTPFGASLLESFGIDVTENSLHLLQATGTGIAVLALARGQGQGQGEGEDPASFARHLLAEFLEGLAARGVASPR